MLFPLPLLTPVWLFFSFFFFGLLNLQGQLRHPFFYEASPATGWPDTPLAPDVVCLASHLSSNSYVALGRLPHSSKKFLHLKRRGNVSACLMRLL